MPTNLKHPEAWRQPIRLKFDAHLISLVPSSGSSYRELGISMVRAWSKELANCAEFPLYS